MSVANPRRAGALTPEAVLQAKVSCEFVEGVFEGVVTSTRYTPELGRLYLVQYSDGDSHELDWQELRELLVVPPTPEVDAALSLPENAASPPSPALAAGDDSHDSATRFKGVWFNETAGKFDMCIASGGPRIYERGFNSAEEAARKYDTHARDRGIKQVNFPRVGEEQAAPGEYKRRSPSRAKGGSSPSAAARRASRTPQKKLTPAAMAAEAAGSGLSMFDRLKLGGRRGASSPRPMKEAAKRKQAVRSADTKKQTTRPASPPSSEDIDQSGALGRFVSLIGKRVRVPPSSSPGSRARTATVLSRVPGKTPLYEIRFDDNGAARQGARRQVAGAELRRWLAEVVTPAPRTAPASGGRGPPSKTPLTTDAAEQPDARKRARTDGAAAGGDSVEAFLRAVSPPLSQVRCSACNWPPCSNKLLHVNVS